MLFAPLGSGFPSFLLAGLVRTSPSSDRLSWSRGSGARDTFATRQVPSPETTLARSRVHKTALTCTQTHAVPGQTCLWMPQVPPQRTHTQQARPLPKPCQKTSLTQLFWICLPALPPQPQWPFRILTAKTWRAGLFAAPKVRPPAVAPVHRTCINGAFWPQQALLSRPRNFSCPVRYSGGRPVPSLHTGPLDPERSRRCLAQACSSAAAQSTQPRGAIPSLVFGGSQKSALAGFSRFQTSFSKACSSLTLLQPSTWGSEAA